MITVILVLCIIVVFVTVYQHFHFRRMYYLSKTTYRLVDLRQETTMFLADNVKGDIPIANIYEYRSMLRMVDDTIQDFKWVEEDFMTIKGLKRFTGAYLAISRPDSKEAWHNGEVGLKIIKVKYTRILLSAFNTIPFVRLHLIAYAMSAMFPVIRRIGIRRLQRMANTFRAIEETYRKDSSFAKMKIDQC